METTAKAGYKITIAEPYDAKIIENAVIANKDDCQIEFSVLTSEKNAVESFALTKKRFENYTDIRVTASNYRFYTFTSTTHYHVMSRTGRTIIYASVPKDQKKEITALIKSLGY